MQSIKDEASHVFYGVDQFKGCLSKFLQQEGEFTQAAQHSLVTIYGGFSFE